MVSESAKLAKEKGNEAFKAGDYPTAIGHYTTAILADGDDPTFYLNRAAAYLKLGKNEDAERDSTKVLSLNPNNVKAFFRRGQARRPLGNFDGARQDFNEALRLEPSNISVKNELADLEKASREMQAKPVPRRRRVPIEVIEPEADKPPATKDEPLLQPVLSRDLRPETTLETKEQLPRKPQTFADAEQARASKDVRVSGGIFRPSGNHTIVTRRANEASREPTSGTADTAPVRSPMTLFDFTKSWNSLETDEARWKLMRTIPPSSLPALFQASLEPDLLKSILHTFQAVFNPSTRSAVRDYLTALMRVQRFGTVMLFMDKGERQRLESLRQEVESL
ncbi:TPR-like protein [Pisolithus croceorrhizus]|nr:TPR-like protein [Pisolithus croceorrhizus]